jgi:hypothetical protein
MLLAPGGGRCHEQGGNIVNRNFRAEAKKRVLRIPAVLQPIALAGAS